MIAPIAVVAVLAAATSPAIPMPSLATGIATGIASGALGGALAGAAGGSVMLWSAIDANAPREAGLAAAALTPGLASMLSGGLVVGLAMPDRTADDWTAAMATGVFAYAAVAVAAVAVFVVVAMVLSPAAWAGCGYLGNMGSVGGIEEDWHEDVSWRAVAPAAGAGVGNLLGMLVGAGVVVAGAKGSTPSASMIGVAAAAGGLVGATLGGAIGGGAAADMPATARSRAGR